MNIKGLNTYSTFPNNPCRSRSHHTRFDSLSPGKCWFRVNLAAGPAEKPDPTFCMCCSSRSMMIIYYHTASLILSILSVTIHVFMRPNTQMIPSLSFAVGWSWQMLD